MIVARHTIRQMITKASKRARELRGFPLAKYENGEIAELLRNSFALARSTEDQWFVQEQSADMQTLDHLQRALAIHLTQHWGAHGIDPPFEDEEEAHEWLFGVTTYDYEAEWYFENSSDYFQRSLWLLISDVEKNISHSMGSEKALDRHHWNYDIDSKSKMPAHRVRFIFDLCVAWARFVDPQLGLPRRDPNPDNPLLRFVRTGMEALVGDKCPHNKSLHTLIHDHLRPEVLEIERERKKMRALEEEAQRVEFRDDPFA